MKIPLYLNLVLILLLTLPSYAWKGKVVRITDGDTLNVITTGGTGERIRLYGIDCPERKQSGGKKATQFVKSLVDVGDTVDIETVDRDRYRRVVGLVTLNDGTLLNHAIVKNGWAWVYTRYCKRPLCLDLHEAEEAAKGNQIGLWAEEAPTPPWAWRKACRLTKTKK